MIDSRSVLLVCFGCNDLDLWGPVSLSFHYWDEISFIILCVKWITTLKNIQLFKFHWDVYLWQGLCGWMVPNQLTAPRNSTDSTTYEYTWHRTQNSCWHVTYVSGRTLGDQEGLYSPLLEIGVPVSAVSGLHFVFFRKMSQCLPCQMDSPKQEKRICNVYLLFYTEEPWNSVCLQ